MRVRLGRPHRLCIGISYRNLVEPVSTGTLSDKTCHLKLLLARVAQLLVKMLSVCVRAWTSVCMLTRVQQIITAAHRHL